MPKIPNSKKSAPYSLTTKMNRGKYKDFTISEIIVENPHYIEYCIDEWEDFELDNEAYEKYTRYLDMRNITKLNEY